MFFCVYRHITPSGKSYIGITSKEPSKRWKEGQGYKTQVFYRAIEKYGWESIQHEILADGLTEEEAKKIERFYIQSFMTTDSKYGYNVSIGGEGVMTGRKHSDQAKQKMSVAHKQIPSWWIGKKLSEEHRKHLSESHMGSVQSEETKRKRAEKLKGHKVNIDSLVKAVVQMDLDGNVIQEFESITDAFQKTGTRHITEVCRGERKQANGFKWKYRKEIQWENL